MISISEQQMNFLKQILLLRIYLKGPLKMKLESQNVKLSIILPGKEGLNSFHK